MIMRGSRWHFKLRIPTDLHDLYAARASKFIEESLRTGDTAAARKLRDAKLRNYERLWAEMRLAKLRKRAKPEAATGDYWSDDSLLLDTREDAQNASDYISALSDKIDRLAQPLAASGTLDDLNAARDEVISSGEGAGYWREIQVLKGSLTPLEPLCWEWFETKRGKAHKTQTEYRRAIAILLENFSCKEDIAQRNARRFLHELLTHNAKATVQKYTTAYRGIWRYHGWDRDSDMWSVREMDSGVDTIQVRGITDSDYLKFMEALRGTRKRKLWLAIRIAAYSGASRSGVCGVRLEDVDTAAPTLYLPETKKTWRTRRVPCHPEIVEDVAEWVRSPLADTTLTNEFTTLKQQLGYGRDTVYHSFRHSVANKLENARISSREIKRLLGHRIGNLTFDTYSAEGLEYEVLSDVVSKLRWPKVDW